MSAGGAGPSRGPTHDESRARICSPGAVSGGQSPPPILLASYPFVPPSVLPPVKK
jgi:hypothetical protein